MTDDGEPGQESGEPNQAPTHRQFPAGDPLTAVSPLDGRYAGRTAPLRRTASEAALIAARTRVEVEYLLALAEVAEVDFELTPDERADLRTIVQEFDLDDARLVKRLETEGAAGYPATNHDVKAVEYFLRTRTPPRLHPWIHFGLTSADVNNLARRILIKEAVREELLPALTDIRNELATLARDHRDLAMLARTHGQPATPTTFGKEMAVYAARLGRAQGRLRAAQDGVEGKLAGASGTYGAHHVAYPDVDWQGFARAFVESLGLSHSPLTTQINPGDDLAELFDAFRAANQVLIDFDRDAWLYVSDRYLGQENAGTETGSSTMPHKVNPIYFENAEGNLMKANADLSFLAEAVTTSRLQRDLSDSTVKRNVGSALAHCLIGYSKTRDGLGKVVPNEQVIQEDLADNPEVIAEAIQTILRREGDTDAYERIKDLTRGQRVTMADFHDLFEDLDVRPEVREELKSLTPQTYTGIAGTLAEKLLDSE